MAQWFHPATTHALINGIPEHEAHFVYNFWQAMTPRLNDINIKAAGDWLWAGYGPHTNPWQHDGWWEWFKVGKPPLVEVR